MDHHHHPHPGQEIEALTCTALRETGRNHWSLHIQSQPQPSMIRRKKYHCFDFISNFSFLGSAIFLFMFCQFSYIINIDNWQVHNQSRRWWVRRPQCRSQPPRATQSPAEQEGTETVCCERLGIENKYSIWILLKHKKNNHSAIYEVVLRGNAWLL